MSRVLIAVFRTGAGADEALVSLRELHKQGDVTLYGTAVMSKNAAGAINVMRAASKTSIGESLECFVSAIIESAGRQQTAVAERIEIGTNANADIEAPRFTWEGISVIRKTLESGKGLLMAVVHETWMPVVDNTLKKHEGLLYRRDYAEAVIELQSHYINTFEPQLEDLRSMVSLVSAEAKPALLKDIENLTARLDAVKRLSSSFSLG